jgi:acylphosphatase
MPPSVVHLSVHFSGHVQGVGFRQATLQVAKEYEVAGFVMNLADGRVRLEVEGAAEVVEAFLAGVLDRMHGHVRNIERVKQIRVAQFQGFALR